MAGEHEGCEWRLEMALAKLYAAGCHRQVADLCDDELDRSGGLLGRVRTKARAYQSDPTKMREFK